MPFLIRATRTFFSHIRAISLAAFFIGAGLIGAGLAWNIAVGGTPLAVAEEEAEPIGVLHLPPIGRDLPNPGELFPLSIALENTKDMGLKVRAFLILDGRITEVPMLSNNLNVADKPEYNAEIHAPLARISYQFVVYQRNGEPKLSERYVVQRDCIPHLTFPSAESLAGLDPTGKPIQPDVRQRLISFIERCTILEREREQYDIAFKLLDELKANLQELKPPTPTPIVKDDDEESDE